MHASKRLIALLCTLALMVGALAGCTAANTATTAEQDAQSQNRQFMSQVNQTMESLADRLDSFNDAVSRGDVVTMRSAADNAFKCIADLEALEAPDALGEIKQQYVDGCNALKDALNAYVGLYAEIESATEDAPFDFGTYDARIAEIQGLYDDGIAKLQEADTAASEA